MTILLLIVALLIVIFGAVLLVGPPFLPTLKVKVETAINLLDLQPGQRLYELGSGDGRLLVAAAKKGISGVGFELNPLLVIYAKMRCLPYRKLVKIRWANYWSIDLQPADGIYIFGLGKYMDKLNKKIIHDIKHPVRVVSFAFVLPREVPVKEEKGLRLYIVQPR